MPATKAVASVETVANSAKARASWLRKISDGLTAARTAASRPMPAPRRTPCEEPHCRHAEGPRQSGEPRRLDQRRRPEALPKVQQEVIALRIPLIENAAREQVAQRLTGHVQRISLVVPDTLVPQADQTKCQGDTGNNQERQKIAGRSRKLRRGDSGRARRHGWGRFARDGHDAFLPFFGVQRLPTSSRRPPLPPRGKSSPRAGC